MADPVQTRKRATHIGTVIGVEKGASDSADDLGLVWGIAIVSTVGGEPYVDSQDEHIPTPVMKRAATKFMRGGRDGKVMHEGDVVGTIVHSVPLDNVLAKNLAKRGVLAEDALLQECWLIAFAPNDIETRKQFDDGELRGFSIFGDGLVVDQTLTTYAEGS